MVQTKKQTTTLTRRAVLGAFVLAAAAGTMTYRRLMVAPDYGGGQLSVTEAHSQAVKGSVILIDIRRPKEWQQTGIAGGAHPIDLRRDDFIQALTAVAGSEKDRPIALICARGVRSARVSLLLTEAGYTNILDVPEGMLGSGAGPGWLAVGLPTQSFPEPSG